MIALILALNLATQEAPQPMPQEAPVVLDRVFKLGEKHDYSVESTLQMDMKIIQSNTYMPRDVDLNYKFSYEVKKLKADGIAQLYYLRPVMTQIEGETGDSPPKPTTIKVNFKLLLDMSPINEFLAIVDARTPKEKKAEADEEKRQKEKEKKEKEKEGEGEGEPPFFTQRSMSSFGAPAAQAAVGQFLQEVHRLALFSGSLDSALDFSPKLPIGPVKKGATWKKTVGYSPQILGNSGRSAVQRLDYTFEYMGIVDGEKGKVYRVQARLKLDTDAAAFVNQSMRMKPEQSGLKSIPLKLNATIDYDLDLKTRQTLLAVANSEGSTAIEVTQFPGTPVQEEKIRGHAEMRLLNPKKR